MMKSKVLDAINKYSLLKNGDRVTVALSGGADSVSLLSVLLELKGQLGITVCAAHFNHMIRGQEAKRDEEFVKALCNRLGVELFCGSADVPAYAKENSVSIELAARKLRYEFLTGVSNGGLVATAHTASDNLETVLFNLTRGTGIDGLCGIPPKRDIFIRPLILCTRAEVEEYCSSDKIEYITDSTNFDDGYTRNNIRLNIIPLLKEINPSVELSALRTSSHLREDSEVLDILANDELEKRICGNSLLIKDLEKLPKPVVIRVLKSFYCSVTGENRLESVHLEALYSKTVLENKPISLPLCLIGCIEDDRLELKTREAATLTDNKRFLFEIAEEKNTFFDKSEKVNNLLLKNLIDCDKIIGQLKKRTRQPGDKVRLPGRSCTKTLNSVFCEKKIPVKDRDILPVLCDEMGIVWVYGIGVCDRCAVSKNTKNIYNIKML